MATHTVSTKAIVTGPPTADGQLNWQRQDVKLRQPQPDEVLVRIIASGIVSKLYIPKTSSKNHFCHTDLVMSMAPPEMAPYPKVLGHEGAGVIKSVGSGISHVKEGDFVLLSFDYCGEETCYNCSSDRPGYCPQFMPKNITSVPGVYQVNGEEEAGGLFFGQSSFSELAVVKGTSAVNVSNLVRGEDELKLFAPFGCGFQTGAGAVVEMAEAGEQDSVVVFGLGGVGMLAIMAAKIQGARTIIGVDLVQSRLDMAKEMGATHTINTSGFKDLSVDLQAAIREIEPSGTTVDIDTTGVVDIVKAGLAVLHPRGQMILIGIMMGKSLEVDLGDLLTFGKSIRGCIEGHAKPQKFVPQLIQWYRDGKLPIEKLIKFYSAEKFGDALAAMHSGTTIKPVLLW